MRIAGIVGLIIVTAAAAFAAFVMLSGLPAVPTYEADPSRADGLPIMSGMDYADVAQSHRRPYFYLVEIPPGAVFVFGAEHTRNPNDPQIGEIRTQWSRFRPTVALIEGRLGFVPAVFANPVQEYGESGAVARLAHEMGTPVFSWEMPLAREVATARRGFSAEQAALYFVLRPYFSNLRHGKPTNPDAMVEEIRAKRTRWPGLEGTLPDMASIDRLWRRDFAGLPDWRDTSDAYGLPGYLAQMGENVGVARDGHLLAAVIELTGKGERVFVVAGSGHAVKIERALNAQP